MAQEKSVESPDGRTHLRLGSLMGFVVVAAVVFGMFVQTGRTLKDFDTAQTRFNAWLVEVEKANPTTTRLGISIKTSTNMFEISRISTATFLTLRKKPITVQARLRSGPFSNVREVTIESSGRTVTWPFQDILDGRKIDLKTEFPETFR